MRSAPATAKRPSAPWIYWDRAATAIAIGLGGLAVLSLWSISHVNTGVGALLFSLFLPCALAAGLAILVAVSIRDRRVRLPVLIAPLVIAMLWIAPRSDFPAEARLALSRPSMDRVAAALPPPPVAPDRQLSDEELSRFYRRDFPGTCPLVLGSYVIRHCLVMPGGYVFLNDYSNGEGGGIAYLPNGLPAHDVGGVEEFVEPIFEPIGGPWYRLILSW